MEHELDFSSYNKIKRASNEELADLWSRYFEDHANKTLRDELILQYIYLTRYVVGRVKVYESIVKGSQLPSPGIPEAFRVLIKEFQALGLDISVINNDDQVVGFKELEMTEDEDEDESPVIEEVNNNKPVVGNIEDIDETEDELEDEFEDIENDDLIGDEIDEELEEIDIDEDEEEIGGEF